MTGEHRGQANFTYGVVEIIRDEQLGNGSYGAVYRARCDELTCAAKVLHPIFGEEGGNRHLRQFDQECHFLRDLRHPNIVQYLGVHVIDNERILLMELMDDNLTNYLELNERNPLPYHTELDICYDVALALAYLHSNYVVHRDLTSNNVLLLGESRVKVSDFGMSKLINPHIRHRSSLTLCPGNSSYMPPEAIDESHMVPYSEKLDCFSYGVLCVQVLTRQFPNPTDRFVRTDRAHLRLEVSEVVRRQEHINIIDGGHPLLDIIMQCLKDSAEERPSAQEICHRLVRLKEEPRYAESLREGNNRPPAPRVNREEEHRREEHVRNLEEQLRQLTLEREELQQQMRRSRAEITRKNREIEEKTRTIAQFERERLQQRQDIELMTNSLEEARIQQRRSEQQFHADIMDLEEDIRRKDETISELTELNGELQEELRRKDQLINHQRAVSERIQNLTLTTRCGGEASCQLRREPDATMLQSTVYFKYFWGKHILSYDIDREEWGELPPCPNSSFSMTTIKGLLTIIGGKKPSLEPTNSLLSYINSEWVDKFPPMPTKRYWTIATRYDTFTVVLGGETEGRTVLCTVEVFNSNSEQWFTACCLPRPFDSATATIYGDQLFLAGGSDENTARCVLSCSLGRLLESCRPAVPGSGGQASRESGVWNRICDLPYYHMTTVRFGDHLLAVGGNEKSRSLPSSAVFVYDRMTDAWIEIGHLERPRSSCFAVSLPRNEVMVVGGLVDGNKATNSIEFLALN